jgi:phasin family protein
MATLDGNPAQKAQQQAEAMKAAYERAVANMKELSDLIQKSNGEAMEVLNRRFAEAMEEVRGLIGQH